MLARAYQLWLEDSLCKGLIHSWLPARSHVRQRSQGSRSHPCGGWGEENCGQARTWLRLRCGGQEGGEAFVGSIDVKSLQHVGWAAQGGVCSAREVQFGPQRVRPAAW